MFFFQIVKFILNTLDFSADFLVIIGGGLLLLYYSKNILSQTWDITIVVQVLQNIELFSASAVLSKRGIYSIYL